MCITSDDEATKISKRIDAELLRDSYRIKNTIKVLLLGAGESGKSTFLKQMKILHKDGFSDEEKQAAIQIIFDNVHESIYTLVTNLRKHNIQLKERMSIQSAQYILDMGPSRPRDIPPEYPTLVKVLWLDDVIREVYEKRNTFQLLDCAQYFLDRIDEIYKISYDNIPLYEPTPKDMLYARTVTKGVHEMSFSVKRANHSYNLMMVDVGGQREERSKWVLAFDDVKVVIFLAACSEFDQTLRENESVNRLTESLKLFRSTWRSPSLRNAGIIVFLNKTDVLEEKLRSGKRIGHYFADYEQYCSKFCAKLTCKKDRYEIQKTKEFIKHKFTEIATPFYLNGCVRNEQIRVERECTLHFTTATNTENIKKVFSDCEHIILTINLKECRFG